MDTLAADGPDSLDAPGGRQLTIRQGSQSAEVTEVGATLRQYTVGGEAMLDGFPASERSSDGRGQLLVPWPNRIRDGRYRFRGEEQQLALTEPPNHNAIHGLVRWANWEIEEAGEARAVLGYFLHPHPGYDFALHLRVTFELGPHGLSHQLEAHNLGHQPLPFGAGAHPYLRLPGVPLDQTLLQSSAASYLEADDRGIPTGRRLPVEGTPLDFRQPRLIQATKLDTCFTDLEFQDGRVEVELGSADSPRRLCLWADQRHPYLVLFTGDSLAPERRRTGLGVEPMTCAPDAFNNGMGLISLDPGERYVGRWGIQYR